MTKNFWEVIQEVELLDWDSGTWAFDSKQKVPRVGLKHDGKPPKKIIVRQTLESTSRLK